MLARIARTTGPVLLILHCLIHFLPINGGQWSELYLYNSIPLVAIAVVASAKRITDSLSKPILITAFVLWFLGSLISSVSSYWSISLLFKPLSNSAYLLFYPFAIMAVPRLINPVLKFSILELFDASIVGLGLTTLGATLALKPVLPHFGGNMADAIFAISFPIADLALISLTITAIAAHGFSRRSFLLALGFSIFTITDFIFLWQHLNGAYSFGSLVDDGWLLAIILIAESLWHDGKDDGYVANVNPIYIALSLFLSATLLALIAIKPSYFPTFVLIPAVTTLTLAFIRMTIALKQAKNIGHERILARTDELTGLPNRRRLLSEIENFVGKNGSLLLLDLDGFKPVNDSHGHEMGDKVLQQVSMRFSRAIPNGALLARLGGDEFGVLLEGSYESAMDVALALRATVSYPFNINNQQIEIGVSIGLAENSNSHDLLRRADDAMYRAKREGLGVCQL
ncbi:MAG: diguanylate cyclase [Actinomycetes bacterium]